VTEANKFDFEIVIGLEVHAELHTNTKIFCNCTTEFGGDPNTHVCEVCLGMPGVLPVLNRKVVDFAIKAGLALNCEIAEYSKFDRKNYYYPDLSKNFQTSQFDLPIAFNGELDIHVNGENKRIGVTRLHMEEDAGKLVHQGATISSSTGSNVDYNRVGVPLIEIVSEPDMRSIDEAIAYFEKLKSYLEYTEVSDCRMDQGSIRCDCNISLRPWGQEELGTRTELKNMNSFKALRRAMEYEIERQASVLRDGGTIIQETRTFDEAKGVTLSLRGKEQAHDYRYFPEPDLVPLVISREWVEDIKNTLPELPDARKQRYIETYDLSDYDASVITSSKGLADYFDECLLHYSDAKVISNWIMGELSKHLNASEKSIVACPIKPKDFAGLLSLLDKGTISGKIAKTVFEEMFATGKDAETIVQEKGLVQISDESAIAEIVERIVAANPQSVEDYKAGKDRAIGFLVGQIMKETKGKANPGVVNKLLLEKLQ
jgi:aspartyl-tRNA(Asn)/glutamyl-tRNA(Gln) amidotransferase subunit B